MLSRQILTAIKNGIIDEADRLVNANEAAGIAYDQVMSDNMRGAMFEDCVQRAAQLYIVTTDAERYDMNFEDVAYQCGCDAFQFVVAFIMDDSQGNDAIQRTITNDQRDGLYKLLDNVNADLKRYQNNYARQMGGGSRPRNGGNGYGSRPRQGNRPSRYDERPRSNGVPSGPRRYGNSSGGTATGANIGRTGGGLGPLSQLRQTLQRPQQQQQYDEEAPVRHMRHAAPSNNIRMGQSAASLRTQRSEPVPQQQVNQVNREIRIQKDDRRLDYGPTTGVIAPTLYDGRKHIPICAIENGVTITERIIGRNTIEGEEVTSKLHKPHDEYLFVPRNGPNKNSNEDADTSMSSLEERLSGQQVQFEELESIITVEKDGTLTANKDAKLPESFNKRIIEIDEAQYGELASHTDHMYRIVNHVNKWLTALNPDVDYSKLVVAGKTIDTFPFSISIGEDVDRILKMLDLVKNRRNIATCLQVVVALNEMLSPRNWTLINDILTEMVNKIGIIDFALPEAIHSFSDDITQYGSLVSQFFGNETYAKFNDCVVDGFLAALVPHIGNDGALTFTQSNRVILLQVPACDLNFNSVTPHMKTGVVSESVFPELHRGLKHRLDHCDNDHSLVMFTRDGVALEIRHSPIGDSITLTLV